MPNIKSARKRMVLSRLARDKNRRARSRLRTALKRVRDATGADEARARLRDAVVLLDRAARTRLLHPHKAARLKGQLARRVSRMGADA